MDILVFAILFLCGALYAAFRFLVVIEFLHDLAKVFLPILTFGKIITEKDIFSGRYFQARRNETGVIIVGAGFSIIFGFVFLSFILGVTIYIGYQIYF